MKIISKASTDI